MPYIPSLTPIHYALFTKIEQNLVLHAIHLAFIHETGGLEVQSLASDGETDGL